MKAAPNVYKNVLLENDQVRVIQIEFAPGETAAWHLSFEIHTGDPMEFFCPLCNASLISDIHKNLAHVILHDESGRNHDVYFSQIVGEFSTFETDGESVHAEGADAGRYTYFKIGDKFRKYF